ncbi:MAG: FGGY-family carbohydrate kinase, partial [Candidatus Limnocylindrales bacterium]
GTSLGPLPIATAEGVGLRAGACFVVGGFDQAMATLGAGASEPGVAHDGSGSWEALSVRVQGRAIEPRLRAGEWSVGPSATDPSRLEAMGSWVGGSAVRWAVGLASGGRASDAAVDQALAHLPAGDPRPVALTDLVAIPGKPLGGAGAIVALDLGTRHADVVLAVLDGLAHRLRLATLTLGAAGVEVTRIRATGGGARSDRWLQLKADATGLPVERPAVREAGAFAAAVLAGSAIGVLPPADAAVRELLTLDRVFEPDPTGGTAIRRAGSPSPGARGRAPGARRIMSGDRQTTEGS